MDLLEKGNRIDFGTAIEWVIMGTEETRWVGGEIEGRNMEERVNWNWRALKGAIWEPTTVDDFFSVFLIYYFQDRFSLW